MVLFSQRWEHYIDWRLDKIDNIDYNELAKRVAEQLEQERNPAPIRQTNIYDQKTGKLLHTTTSRQASPFGVGWAMLKKKPLLEHVRNLSAPCVRILFYLILRQTYGEYVFIAPSGIAKDLCVSAGRIHQYLTELEKLHLIRRCRIDGVSAILLNPAVTACGRNSLAARQKLWAFFESYAPLTSHQYPNLPGGGDILEE